MKKAQSQTCAREEVHGATQGIPSWAHRLGPQALGAKRTCLWRSPYGRAGTWPLKEMTSFGFCGDGISFPFTLITTTRKYHVAGIPFSFTLITKKRKYVSLLTRKPKISRPIVDLVSHNPAVGGAVSGARGTRASRPASRVSLLNDRFGSKRGKGRAALSGTPHWSLRRGEAAETGERLLYEY